MIQKILNHQSKNITFAAGILAFSSLLNGILALFRDRLLASRFGASEQLDIYFASFRIPDLIYGILVAGGIISVFLPVFSQYYLKDEKRGWEFTNIILNCFLILLVFLCSLLVVFTPFLIDFIAPGFGEDAKQEAISLTRIMLLSPFFFVLSSIFSGVLHYFNRFLIYSLAPILYTIGIIIGILFFVPIWGLTGLALGVIFGAFLHLIIQIPSAISVGFRYRPNFNFKFPGLWKTIRLMIPRTIGATANHINLIVITAIASTLIAGSISIFNFADHLQKFAIGLIGISFASATFPVLSKAYTGGQKKEFLSNLFLSIRQILFLIIPASFLILLLRAQLVRLILGTGEFGWLDTKLTAASLGIFAFGIFAHCLIPLITKTFFSLQDTKTPVTITVLSIGLNILLSFFFVWLLSFNNIFEQFIRNTFKIQGIKNIQVLGLPLALTFSGIINISFLFWFLIKKIKKINFNILNSLEEENKKVFYSLGKILVISSVMIFAGRFVLGISANFVNMKTFIGIAIQTLLAVKISILIYLFLSFIVRLPELSFIKKSIIEQFGKNES